MYEIELQRFAFKPTYTIGRLILPNWNSSYFCNTLEDPDRGLDHLGSDGVYNGHDDESDCSQNKIKTTTCIPYGRYQMVYYNSPKFTPRYGTWMPVLLEVPHYSGILFHPGNDAKDTDGCILLGENKQIGKVLNSRYWFDKFVSITKPIWESKEKIWVTIKKF